MHYTACPGPWWTTEITALVDEGARHRFLLTGTSARKLQRGAAGRHVAGIYLDPEGGEDVLDAYATVYLREEIQAQSIRRNVGTCARFLDVAAASSGDWTNYSKLSSDTGIARSWKTRRSRSGSRHSRPRRRGGG